MAVERSYEISIKTIADLKAAREVKQAITEAIEQTQKMGGDTSRLEEALAKTNKALASQGAYGVQAAEGLRKAIENTKALRGDTKVLEQELARIQKGAGVKFGDGFLSKGWEALKDEFPALGRAATLAFNPIALGAAALAEGFHLAAEGVRAFANEERVLFQLDSALARNGLLTKNYREELRQLGEEMSSRTGVKAEKWLNVLTVLTRAGANANNINELAEGVENLAGSMSGSGEDNLEAAATIVGRALNGNTEDLKRLGIQIDETASKDDKLRQFLKRAAELGGGQMKSANEGFAGSIDRLQNTWDKFLSSVGKYIVNFSQYAPVLFVAEKAMALFNRAMDKLVPNVITLNNKLPSLAASTKGFGSATQETSTALKTEAEKARDLADALSVVRRRQDELVDAKLAAELAEVDAEEANSPQTPANAAKFASKRQRLRKNADQEKIDLEDQRISEDERKVEEDRTVRESKEDAAKLRVDETGEAHQKALESMGVSSDAEAVKPYEKAQELLKRTDLNPRERANALQAIKNYESIGTTGAAYAKAEADLKDLLRADEEPWNKYKQTVDELNQRKQIQALKKRQFAAKWQAEDAKLSQDTQKAAAEMNSERRRVELDRITAEAKLRPSTPKDLAMKDALEIANLMDQSRIESDPQKQNDIWQKIREVYNSRVAENQKTHSNVPLPQLPTWSQLHTPSKTTASQPATSSPQPITPPVQPPSPQSQPQPQSSPPAVTPLPSTGNHDTNRPAQESKPVAPNSKPESGAVTERTNVILEQTNKAETAKAEQLKTIAQSLTAANAASISTMNQIVTVLGAHSTRLKNIETRTANLR